MARKSTPAKRIESAIQRSTLNPRQAQFMRRYADPASATFGNAYQSALAVGYAESTATKVMSLLMESNGETFAEVLEAAGVTDRALAQAHKSLLTCGEAPGVAMGVRLGYQIKRHLPTPGTVMEDMLKRIGGTEDEAKRSVELVKRTPTDPHEIRDVCERYLTWYAKTYPNGREP